MATENATPSRSAAPKTREIAFNEIPADAGRPQFQVAAGGDGYFALSTAGALESCVAKQLEDGVDGGVSSEVAYLCAFAMRAATALRASVGGEA